jgi:nitrate reductase NapAB chaperone NapD
MEELFKKENVQDLPLRRLITKLVSTNLGSLSEPCFVPSTRKDYYDFLHYTGLTDSEVGDYRKRMWKGRKEEKFANLFKDNPTTFYLSLLSYFLKNNDAIGYESLFIYFTIRQYSQQMARYFSKYCNPEVFTYSLNSLTKTHLFSREKTIPNALYYLSKELMKRYKDKIKKFDLDGMSSYFMETRHRISQSLKSFASVYYQASEEGKSIITPELEDDEENLYQYQEQEKSNKIIDKVVHQIVVYKQIDEKAKEEARDITKVNIGIASGFVSKMLDTKFSDQIRLILKLFFNDIKSVNMICGKEYYTFLRQLMSIKRTTSKIFFKQQVGILVDDLVKDLDYRKQYSKLTNQTKFLLNLFIAYYITLLVRKTICGIKPH